MSFNMVHSLDEFKLSSRSSSDTTIIIVQTELCQLKLEWVNMAKVGFV